jgi:hypothetical protein
MAKRPKPEEIVAKLRQADVLISQDQSVAEAICAIEVTQDPCLRRLAGAVGQAVRGGGADRALTSNLGHFVGADHAPIGVQPAFWITPVFIRSGSAAPGAGPYRCA